MMRLVLGIVVVVQGCGGTTASQGGRTESRDPRSGHDLNDVQLECRSDLIGTIGVADKQFGPTCAKPTMPLALQYFDLGTLSGYIRAERHVDVMEAVCACEFLKCAENGASMETVAKLAEVTSKNWREFVEQVGKAEREGVQHISDFVAGHNCLDAAIAAELYKLGYRCAYTTGIHGELLRKRMDHAFLKTSDVADRAATLERAAACWASIAAQPLP